MAKKKSFELFCFSCDVDFIVKLNEENTKMEAKFCPLCGEEIEQEDDEVEIEEDEDEDQDDDSPKNRWN